MQQVVSLHKAAQYLSSVQETREAHRRIIHKEISCISLFLILQGLLEGPDPGKDVLVQIYKCGVCAETFGELNELQEHVVKHKKEQDQSCTKCNASFKSKSKLQVKVEFVEFLKRLILSRNRIRVYMWRESIHILRYVNLT